MELRHVLLHKRQVWTSLKTSLNQYQLQPVLTSLLSDIAMWYHVIWLGLLLSLIHRHVIDAYTQPYCYATHSDFFYLCKAAPDSCSTCCAAQSAPSFHMSLLLLLVYKRCTFSQIVKLLTWQSLTFGPSFRYLSVSSCLASSRSYIHCPWISHRLWALA